MIPFETTHWDHLPITTVHGETGFIQVRTRDYGSIRVRKMEYSPDYLSDHSCEKGHIAYCISGEFALDLSDGSTHTLTAGMSFQVSDGTPGHRGRSRGGAVLFIVDGDFLAD